MTDRDKSKGHCEEGYERRLDSARELGRLGAEVRQLRLTVDKMGEILERVVVERNAERNKLRGAIWLVRWIAAAAVAICGALYWLLTQLVKLYGL